MARLDFFVHDLKQMYDAAWPLAPVWLVPRRGRENDLMMEAVKDMPYRYRLACQELLCYRKMSTPKGQNFLLYKEGSFTG
jgi:hypothetical protein